MKCIKVAFSKEKVGHALRDIQKTGKRMRAYECDRCYRWHLTSDINHEKAYKFIKR